MNPYVFARLPGVFAMLVCLMLAAAILINPVRGADDNSAAAGLRYSDRGLRDCLKCHGEDAGTPVVAILNTPHAVTGDAHSPFGGDNHSCEGCHGPSGAHADQYDDDALRPPPAITFGPPSAGFSPVAEQNRVCLDCHQPRGHAVAWQGSVHEQEDVTCAGCHLSHSQQDPVIQRRTQTETCGVCHRTERVEAMKASHHPMNEGLVICTDCHEPHGSLGEASLIEATINDTCYECHPEKRGPFLWEHEPVQEDCTNCHFPHGSNNQRLLKARPPFLCQQCHTAGHASHQYNAADLPLNPAGLDARDIQKLYAKGCTNCHSQVHGSNHPSGVRRHR